MPPVLPYVPQRITVHLGTPASNAPNVTVNFSDYVKNVASSEIYPTWDESALRANILAAFPEADVQIRPTGGLCSFYAEKGGLIIGFEK